MSIEGPRAATVEEIPAVVELVDSVFRPGSGESMGRQYPLLFAEDNAGDLRIFSDDGRPIALIAMLQRDVYLAGTHHRSCVLGSVCTNSDYRGQGLATRLLDDARAKALRGGCDIVLISGGRELYKRAGYVEVGGYRRSAVRPDRLPQKRRVRLRRWQPQDVPTLVRLHSCEPVRFARPPEDFLALLECGRVVNAAADTRLICSTRGEPLAYVTYRLPGAGRLGKDELSIDEMAGARWAVAQALGLLFEEYGVRRLFVEHLAWDLEMEALANSHGWRTESHAFGGTVGIIDPERFWAACAPLFEERLGTERAGRLKLDASAGPRVEYGCDTLKLDGMGGLTRLAFEPRERRPKPAADSELAGVLDEVFPLPLVSYGLNYV